VPSWGFVRGGPENKKYGHSAGLTGDLQLRECQLNLTGAGFRHSRRAIVPKGASAGEFMSALVFSVTIISCFVQQNIIIRKSLKERNGTS
jgi:hypothetical protein